MIDDLLAGQAANFHVLKKPLSKASVADLFRDIRQRTESPSQNLFMNNREEVGGSHLSALCFLYDSHPSFLVASSGVVERRCGFLMLVEYRNHVAVYRSGLEIPPAFTSKFFGRVAPDRIDVAVAGENAVFEKIRLRNMSLSKDVMRTKTLEADNLQMAVGSAGSTRYVPRGYAVRSGRELFSTTHSTGRITRRSDKVGYPALVEYAADVIDRLLDNKGDPAAFIRTFARSVDLSTIDGIPALSFAVDVAGLSHALHETEEIRLVRGEAGGIEQLTSTEVAAVLQSLNDTLDIAVEGDGKKRNLVHPADGAQVGSITRNKTRIALSGLNIPTLFGVEVESTVFNLGADPDRTSLRQYIDRSDLFIVLFEDIALAYMNGQLFRDPGITGGGDEFLRHLREEPLLGAVTSEKGLFTAAQTKFDATSTFGVVETSTSAGDEVLVCDDLSNEWADFIGISNVSNPPRISFYHAKHGSLSIGASSFHEAVGQALKNLGNLALPAGEMDAKIKFWNTNYVNSGVATSISRTIRATPLGLSHEIDNIRLAPDKILRVYIVTSSLSLQAVGQRFKDIVAGNRPNPFFVQLYWLLASYFSACVEMNAQGYVICRP